MSHWIIFFSAALSALVWPGRSPPSCWPWRTQTRRLSGEQPNLPAIAVSASRFALILVAVFNDQPHRAFAELGGIRLRGLILFLSHNGQLSESFALRQTRGGSDPASRLSA